MTDSIHAHPDNKGVFVERWVLDLLDGDHPTALLFSQLLWWHQPGKDGQPKVRYERNGHKWLLRADDEWESECSLTVRQVRRSRAVLVKLGLIEHRRFKRDGAPTSAWRPLYESIQSARTPIRPNPELPSERHFQGTDAQTSDGSDVQASVPKEKTSERDTSKTTESPGPRRSRRVPPGFSADDGMRVWAMEHTPLINIDRATEAFVDYWQGSGKTKADWVATWRNWMRREQESAERRPQVNGFGSRRPTTTVERSWQNIKATEHLS